MGKNLESEVTVARIIKWCSSLENSWADPQKAKYKDSIWFSNSTPSSIAKRTENMCPHKKLYINVHTLFIVKRWKNPKCPSTDGQKNVYPCYSGLFSLKTEWSLIHTTTQLSLKNSMLIERSQTRRATYSRILLIWKVQNRQVPRNTK